MAKAFTRIGNAVPYNADPILDDESNIRTLLFRLKRGGEHPQDVSIHELASLCREAKLVIEGLKERER